MGRFGSRVNQRDNFIWLLIALVLLLFSGAVFAQLELRWGQQLVNISLMLTLLVGIWTLEAQRAKWLSPKIAMSFVVVPVFVYDTVFSDGALALAQITTAMLFLGVTTFLAWRQVIFTGTVDGNKIVGAICIYILIGLVFAFAYLLVEYLLPGSMAGLDHKEWQANLEDLVYYSIVTLTTLGYGDITPEQPITRFLAYMEAITGVFYTAILVASLIGLRLAAIEPRPDGD